MAQLGLYLVILSGKLGKLSRFGYAMIKFSVQPVSNIKHLC